MHTLVTTDHKDNHRLEVLVPAEVVLQDWQVVYMQFEDRAVEVDSYILVLVYNLL
jgi:hypothetical protein